MSILVIPSQGKIRGKTEPFFALGSAIAWLFKRIFGGADETRTRDLLRDRQFKAKLPVALYSS
jgi:hypothetical protein